MKTLLRITVTLALPVIYFIIASAFKPTEPLKVTDASKVNLIQPPTAQIPKDFTHFILNYGIQDGDNEWDNFTAFWPYYKDTLHYNGIQLYDYGADTTGQFGVPLRTDQIATVNSLITGTQNRGLRSNFQRINISKLCQDGQRMVFESEGGNEGYSYSSRMSGSGPVSDSGRSVIKGCASCPPSMPAGMLCESVTENLQFALSYTYDWAPQQNWHLKPVMRIKQSDFSANDTRPVVAIYTRNFDGVYIDTVILRVRNFANGSGQYFGQYTDKYTFQGSDDSMLVNGRKDTATGLMYGYTRENVNASQIDFKIYWFGQVDVWFDKLVVDNDIANRLFLTDTLANFNQYLNAEVNNFGNNLDMFFVDECVTTNLPCIKYVNDYIKNSGLPSPPLSYAVSYNMNFHYTRNDANTFKMYLDTVKPDIIQVDAHALQFHDQGEPGCIPINSFDSLLVDPKVPADWKVNNQTYNTYLQECLGQKDSYVWPMEGSFIYQIHKTRENITSASNNTRISIQPQIQGWLIHNNINGKFRYGCREPLNEEISAQAWIALSYGADYLNWFWLPTMTPLTADVSQRNGPMDMSVDPGDETYTFGVFDTPSQPRRQNLYGQNKFDYLCTLNSKILNLKPTLDAITWNSAYSVHSEGANHGYIQDIMSILPGINGQNPCVEDHPNGPYMDCTDDRYWEMGFYNDIGTAKYFVMVNRRCIPSGGGYAGDNRVLRIKFNLTGPVNWQISEVGSSVRLKVFDRTKYASFGENPGEMGWFNPGEGKLFKIEPAFPKGGILVADEVISGGEFTCEAPVYNNGYNITIGANTTIHFNDSSKFVMDGGVFTVGDQNTSAPQNITSDAATGTSWSGHRFTNCEVKIYGATFTGLANDTTYAVNIIDCPVVDIRNCTFNINSSLKGGVNAVFFSDPNNEISLSNIYIGANTFNSSGSTIPTVNISSYAGETTPLIIENNTFNEGNTAIFLSGITGGAIKGNSITDNFIGINALTSSIDIKSNTISSTVNNALGIFAAGGSELKMNNAGSKTLGGLNDISNSGTAANNIVVDGSVFLLDGGQNIFNITDDQTSKHLYGYFPLFTAVSYDETNNCFKLNSSPVDPPYNVVTSGFQGSQITFNFTPYLSGCEANEGGDGFAINLGDGIYDTIYNEGSGSGGSSHSSRLLLAKGEYPQGEGVYYKQAQIPPRRDFEMTSSFLEYDSISVLMRYRNYTQAKTKCLDLINTYPDSIQSLNAVSKLFLSTVASDTSYNAVNELKIYYEDLILNHGYNTSLVKRANYYILKCKVRMREYTQALAGFQQIINQNPYSYEGLIARWDYMATSLLIQGQGGAFSNLNIEVSSSIDIVNALQREANDDDRSPFTKEQRQDIRKSINTAIEISKDEDDRKIKTLEVKSEQGDVNASKELEQIRSLKQVVKTEKPKSIIEHVRIVSEDIRKVFGSNTSGKGNEPKNIPMVFRLSQNYPNPFNPVTKINYDLPKDSKVRIVIYDILGREVKRLVNSELKTAGSYIVDFNASNYASGVYFYRIEAEEPNGNKFVDSKKMVLLK